MIVKPLLACAIASAVFTTGAEAAQRAIVFDLNGMARQGGAGGVPNISLPDTGSPNFLFGFTLPPDYKNGTTAKIRLYGQSGTSCGVALRVAVVERRRAGFPPHVTTTPVDGINPNGITIMSFPATASAVLTKTFEVKSPASAPFSGLKRGDGLVVEIHRVPGDAGDTCGQILSIDHLEVRYTVR